MSPDISDALFTSGGHTKVTLAATYANRTLVSFTFCSLSLLLAVTVVTVTIVTAMLQVKKSHMQQLYNSRRMTEVLIPSSGKMVLIDKLLPKLKKEGHKVGGGVDVSVVVDFVNARLCFCV